MASRYRPVSVLPESENQWSKRSSTFTSSTFRPWSSADLKTPNQTIRNIPVIVDDDDDEQGWAEMAAKRDKKSKTWKMRKGKNALQELYNGPI